MHTLQLTQSPLSIIPVEIVIIDQHRNNDKVKLTGLWDELKSNPIISPVIVAMIDAMIALNEDLYLYADIVIGADQYYVSQIV